MRSCCGPQVTISEPLGRASDYSALRVPQVRFTIPGMKYALGKVLLGTLRLEREEIVSIYVPRPRTRQAWRDWAELSAYSVAVGGFPIRFEGFFS